MPDIVLTPATKKLIQQYQSWHQFLHPKQGITISVDEIASKVASFYEKIREVVEWQEKHLMRRIAIERILRRRLLLRINKQEIAEVFVLELIRGGHFANNQIEKTKIKEIREILNKYSFILNNAPSLPANKTQSEFYNQIFGIAACEIEKCLAPSSYLKIDALISYMEEVMTQRIKIGERALNSKKITNQEKNTQIYIAVQQALFKLDRHIISYNLIKRWYPNWANFSQLEIEEITKKIFLIWNSLEKTLSHPLANKFYKICEKYDTAYLLLGDVLSESPIDIEEKIIQPKILEELITRAYRKRLRTLKSRMRRAAFYSTLSIFITNIFTLYLLELPFAKYVMGHINLFAAIIDVLGPTTLMFILVMTIKLPSKENLELVLSEVKKIVYQQESNDIYEVEIYPKRGFISKLIIGLLYALSFCICFGTVIWCLYRLSYPPLSYLLLTIFTCLIAFTGVRIRQRSKELHIKEEKEHFFHILVDPLSVPVIQVGKWILSKWRKVNFVGTIFNVLIDMPFLIFVEFLEQWRYFLKEKNAKGAAPAGGQGPAVLGGQSP